MPTVFSEQILYLHIEKTGGNSATAFLLRVLPRPVWYQCWHPRPEAADDGAHHIPGPPHMTLADAADLLRQHDLDVAKLPLILAVLRNPYEVAVSEYEYFRRPDRVKETGRMSWRQRLALSAPFPEYARGAYARPGADADLPRYSDMFLLDGVMPDNLRIVEYDNLVGGIKDELRAIGIESDAEFPWLNRSEYGDWRAYYTAEAEAAIYEANRWLFDAGIYPRLRLDDVAVATAPERVRRDGRGR